MSSEAPTKCMKCEVYVLGCCWWCWFWFDHYCKKRYIPLEALTKQERIKKEIEDTILPSTPNQPPPARSHPNIDDLTEVVTYNTATGECSALLPSQDSDSSLTLNDFLADDDEAGFSAKPHFDKLESIIRGLFRLQRPVSDGEIE